MSVPVARTPSTKRYAPPEDEVVNAPVPVRPPLLVVTVVLPAQVGAVPDENAQPVVSVAAVEAVIALKSCV